MTRSSGIFRAILPSSAAPVGRFSGGSPRRAALVLLGLHAIPVVLAWAAWAIGLAPPFWDLRVLVAVVVGVIGFGGALAMMLYTGGWGVGVASGIDWGENYHQTFSPRAGLALGWLRWLLQLLMIFGVVFAFMAVFTHGRWWQVVGTEETRGLPALAQKMPFPDGWTLTDEGAGEYDDDGPLPYASYHFRFDVPRDYTLEQLKAWITSPAWTPAFGPLQLRRCSPWGDGPSGSCTAHIAPPAGERPEYVVDADLSQGRNRADVKVALRYRQHEEPDWAVDQQVVDRARAIPVPASWSKYDESALETSEGQSFTQRYAVPADFTHEDLQAWLAGDAWTTGTEPFGAITVEDDCRPRFETTTRHCSAAVVSSERDDDDGVTRFREWVTVTLDESEDTVRLKFRTF